MIQRARRSSGFTVVELLLVIVVIAVLATLTVVTYGGIQRQAASSQVMTTLRNVYGVVSQEIITNGGIKPSVLPAGITIPSDISLSYIPLSDTHYSGLTTVQQGVLFHDICEQLVENPYYSTAHSRDGSDAESVILSCDDNIQANTLQITGWDSMVWSTPLQRSTIEAYIESVPYDDWWTDKQAVIRNFYTTLMNLYTGSGGSWPVASFWDSWATQHSGVMMQALPEPDVVNNPRYCLVATHRQYGDVTYVITADNPVVRQAVACA